jgi:hypothetical protein
LSSGTAETLAAIARPYQFSDWAAGASAASPASCYRLLEYLRILPVVESEYKLVQVQRQILRRDVMIIAMMPHLKSDQNDSIELVCTRPRTYSSALESMVSCGYLKRFKSV